MEAFNQSMSQVRVSTEWICGDVIKSFKSMDFKSNAMNYFDYFLAMNICNYLIAFSSK